MTAPIQPGTRLICPLIAATVEAMRADMIAAVAEGADCLECRLDYLSHPPDDEQLRDLLTNPPRPVIVTCRPVREGGRFDGQEAHRLALLRRAGRFEGVEAVDVEFDVPAEDWPAEGRKIILSRHDFQAVPDDLDELARAMDQSPAAVNKLVVQPAGADEALRVFDVLRACRKPTLALAMSEAGLITRILARKFGAFGTFAALTAGQESAPGQVSLAEMKHLYRWDAIGPDTDVFGVIGCPVTHSMSPAIHNAAFAATAQNAVYVPLRIEPGNEPFFRFLDAVRQRAWLSLRGLSVTIPHKENALACVGAEHCDALAVRIGAINTITLREDGSLRGENTDYAGAIDALCEAMSIARPGLKGRSAAVLGAGGVARAIVAALREYGATVTIYNRTLPRAEALAEEFGCVARPIARAGRTDAEIVVNCTSLGMHPKVRATPLRRLPESVKIVFDTIYNPVETRLLRDAQAAGRQILSGVDMFVHQAAAQFETWTRLPAPREVMREAVLRALGNNEP